MTDISMKMCFSRNFFDIRKISSTLWTTPSRHMQVNKTEQIIIIDVMKAHCNGKMLTPKTEFLLIITRTLNSLLCCSCSAAQWIPKINRKECYGPCNLFTVLKLAPSFYNSIEVLYDADDAVLSFSLSWMQQSEEKGREGIREAFKKQTTIEQRRFLCSSSGCWESSIHIYDDAFLGGAH